jgi:hypothetical protein
MVRRSVGDRPRLPVRQKQDQATESKSGPQRLPGKGMRGKPELSDILDRLSKGIRVPAGSTFVKTKGD